MPSSPFNEKRGRTTLSLACHIAFGQHTQSNDVGRGITSPPLDNTHGPTRSGVACHNRLWAAHTVERRRVWHAIIAYGRQTRSNDVKCDMPSPPLDSTHGRMTSGRACHHRLWAAHRSKDVGRGMKSPPLDSTHGKTTSGVTCHHRLWTPHTVGNVGRGMTSSLLDSTHGRTTSDMACHHRPWAAHTVGLRRAWHVITSFGQHTW